MTLFKISTPGYPVIDPVRSIVILIALLALTACDMFEDSPVSTPFENAPPETYLSISTQTVIYTRLDSIDCDSMGLCDTLYSYYFEADSIPPGDLDTLQNALQTVLASTQTMTWWGEDPDGDVIGYFYKWQHDQDWTYTTNESVTDTIPIRTAFGIFGFAVKAMDSDSLVDATPAEIILQIRNTPPVIDFRYLSNPIVTGGTADVTERTFPTRTFLWTVADDDGIETVDSIYYALDSTSHWNALGASEKGITLTDLAPGNHVFYLMARDVAGAISEITHYPDINDDTTPNTWEVMEPIGDVLLVDDFYFDQQNRAMDWYMSILDTLPGIGPDGYSVWEIGRELPFSEKDVSATLNYFNRIIWYSAATGPENYGDASNPINAFIEGGGNLLMNVTELLTSAAVWCPFDSTAVINPSGRLFAGTNLESTINEDLNLQISKLIPYRVKSFALNDTTLLDPILGPRLTSLYRLPEPSGADAWLGRPTVAAEYDHQSPINQVGGKAILFSMPFHDGTNNGSLMEGNGSAAKFISWVLLERFAP
ncbi:hypothetical protein HQ531_04535 [bacterium]|nr:hypothetical protein [bacterium]